MRLWKTLLSLATGLLATGAYPVDNESTFNMTTGITPLSRDIYYLHMTMFWICVLIVLGVFSVLIYTVIKHHKVAEHTAARFHSSLKVELLWMIIPFIILIIMAIPAIAVLFRTEDTAKSGINIKLQNHSGNGSENLDAKKKIDNKTSGRLG